MRANEFQVLTGYCTPRLSQAPIAVLRIRDTRIPLVNLFTDTDPLLSEKLSYVFLHIVSFSFSPMNFVSENLLLSMSVIFLVKKANL
jgi:hypothetical protein